jgi:hypothetical protein
MIIIDIFLYREDKTFLENIMKEKEDSDYLSFRKLFSK